MKFKELIEKLSNDRIVQFSTATTGLKPVDSEIIAVSYFSIENGVVTEDTIYQDVQNKSKFLESQEFHKVDTSVLKNQGKPKDIFAAELGKLIENATLFSYNPRFQYGFLSEMFPAKTDIFVHDLALMLKGADMHMCQEEDDVASLSAMESKFINRIGKTPSMRIMAEARYKPVQEGSTETPVRYNAKALFKFWQLLADVDVIVQGQLHFEK